MTSMDEAERLRREDAAWDDEATRGAEDSEQGAVCLVAQTTKLSSYPTSAQAFYACNPYSIAGTETEGAGGILKQGPGTFLALNIGTAVPPQGTPVLATFVKSRWVFRYDG